MTDLGGNIKFKNHAPLYTRSELYLVRVLLSEGDMDLLREHLVLSVGEFGDILATSANGCLVSLERREKIPRLGSHWK